MRYFILLIWLISFIALLDISLDMINNASTVSNIIGVCLLATIVWVSIKTKCLTNIKNKKDEKDN